MSVLAVAADTTNQLIAAGAALAGATIGGVITLIATVLQNRHATAERKAEAATARRERVAAVIGRVQTFLSDANFERVGANVDPERTPHELEALSVRLSALRDELMMFAGADEDDRVMARTGELEIALLNTLHLARWHASDLIRRRDIGASLSHAQWWHLRATALAQVVLDLVRGRDVAELEDKLRKLDQTKPTA